MKRLVRSDLNYNKLNAYSGTKYLCAAIQVMGRPIIATNVESGIEWEVPDDERGGIIVFSEEVNAVKLSENKLINWIKQKAQTLSNRFSGMTFIDDIAQSHNLVGWTVGNFLKGRYTGRDGNVYSENSLSVEIVGVPDSVLIQIAEELCRKFVQETVLVKEYSTNKLLFVNGD